MDFAKKQLEKYGWKEGQGLGKSNDGISKPIKAKLKFDTAGIGHDAGKELVNDWWSGAYNSALDNVEVKTEENGEVQVTRKGDDSIEISTKGYLSQLKKNNISLEYGSFLKTSKLTETGTIDYGIPNFDITAKEKKAKLPSDHEIYSACGGRTAHKGARHGLNQTGKLARLERQEQMLLKKLQNVSISDDKTAITKKMKKLVKNKEKNRMSDVENSLTVFSCDDESMGSTGSSSRKKHKKKRKERKTVSFNTTVTVTEYIVPEVDSSRHSSDSNENTQICTDMGEPMRDTNRNESSTSRTTDLNANDEGIEQDLEIANEVDSSHKSFEQARYREDKLSKAERKLRKKNRKANRATNRFIQEVMSESSTEQGIDDIATTSECLLEEYKCAKRKLADADDCEDVGAKRHCNDPSEKKKKKKLKEKRREKRKKEREEKKSIRSITKSLDKLCNISDES